MSSLPEAIETVKPAPACCPEGEKLPCRSCQPADHPADMADSYRAEHHRAMVRELAIAREMSRLAFAPDPSDASDPSELRDDEMPGAYPVFYPSPEDAAWEADNPTFLATLARAGDLFRSSANTHLRWLAGEIDRMYEDARRLGARDGEQMMDRLDAERDSLSGGPDAGRVPWSAVAGSMNW